jgi:hypothetical protein
LKIEIQYKMLKISTKTEIFLAVKNIRQIVQMPNNYPIELILFRFLQFFKEVKRFFLYENHDFSSIYDWNDPSVEAQYGIAICFVNSSSW